MVVEVQQGDVDGVPAFWVDSGRPTLAASLVTRRGMVDESLPTTGWTHLLEHLALHDRAAGALHVNGSVSLLITKFDAHGPADRVAAFLEDLTRWLADPECSELAREQSVLRAEAALRRSGEVGQALLWRYGAQGPGLSAHAEPGLSRATAEDVRALAAGSFTRDNCALFLDGPPPAGLRLHLPAGERRPSPPAVPCDETLPAAYLIESGISLSGVVPRSSAATVLPTILREVLNAEFREKDGGAYAPWCHYEPVDDERAVVFAGSDANAELHRSIVDRTLYQLDQVAKGEFRRSFLDDTVEQMVQAFTDPYAVASLAMRAVHQHLRGESPSNLDQVVAEVRAVDVDAVVEAASQVKASLLLGVAHEANWKDPMPILAMPSRARLEGRTHRSRSYPAERSVLVVGREALQVGVDAAFRTVHRDDVVGLFVYPDGGREAVTRDGWSVAVEPTLWASGEEAASAVDTLVPADLHIPMLAREPQRIPRPASTWQRLRSVVDNDRAKLGLVVGILVWLGVVVGYMVVTGDVPVAAIVGGLVAATVAIVRRRRPG